jgi:hypothetical protein
MPTRSIPVDASLRYLLLSTGEGSVTVCRSHTVLQYFSASFALLLHHFKSGMAGSLHRRRRFDAIVSSAVQDSMPGMCVHF